MTVGKSILSLALLSLMLALTVSGPALSGENPWDRDDGPGTYNDTILDTIRGSFEQTFKSSSDSDWNWFDRLYVDITVRVALWVSDFGTNEAKGESSVTTLSSSQSTTFSLKR